MGFKIIWTDSAVSDLEDVFYFIAGDNPEAARRVALEIVNHIEILASFPFIGPNYPRGSRGTLRHIVVRSYRIFYDVNENRQSVEILHVWHGAREDPTF